MSVIDYEIGKAFRVGVGTYADIFWHMNHLPKEGDDQPSHHHPIAHVTFLVRGKIRAEIENYPYYEYTAPAFIEVPAERDHRYVALSDNVIYFCLFNYRLAGYGARKSSSPEELNMIMKYLCKDCPGCGDPTDAVRVLPGNIKVSAIPDAAE